MNRNNHRLYTATVLLAVSAVFAFITFYQNGTYFDRYNPPALRDFIEYWAAYRAWTNQVNLYSPYEIRAIQQGVLGPDAGTIMMWNPPWTLPIISPVAFLDYFSASRIWFVANLGLLLACGYIIWRLYNGKTLSPLLCTLTALMFIPALSCIKVGQISLLLTTGLVLFLVGAERKRELMAGVGLAILTIKLHLFVILAPFIFWWIIRERRYKILYAGGFIWLFLIGVTLAVSPQSIWQWIFGRERAPFVADVFDWKVSTVVGLIRSAAYELTGTAPTWPILIIPILAILCSLGFIIKKRPTLEWSYHLPILTSISLFVSPHAHLWDFSLLLPGQVIAVSKAFAQGNKVGIKALLAFGALQVITAAALIGLKNCSLEMALFPVLFCVTFLWSYKRDIC